MTVTEYPAVMDDGRRLRVIRDVSQQAQVIDRSEHVGQLTTKR